MLKISHISKTFFRGTPNEKKALIDLSLTLNDGDFVLSSVVMVRGKVPF